MLTRFLQFSAPKRRRTFVVREWLNGMWASLYYFNIALDQDFGNLLNWNTSDSSGGTPAGSVPSGSDDAWIGTGVINADMPTNNTLTPVTAMNSFNSSNAAIGSQILNTWTNGITVANGVVVGVSGDVTSQHNWYGTMTGGALVLYGSSQWWIESSMSFASVTLNDASSIAPAALGTLTTLSGDFTQASGANINCNAATVTFAVGGNASLSGSLVNGSGGVFSLSATGNITLASITLGGGTLIQTTGCTNFSATGSTTWTGNLPTSGTISGDVTFTAGTTWAANVSGGNVPGSCGGNMSLTSMTISPSGGFNELQLTATNITIDGVTLTSSGGAITSVVSATTLAIKNMDWASGKGGRIQGVTTSIVFENAVLSSGYGITMHGTSDTVTFQGASRKEDVIFWVSGSGGIEFKDQSYDNTNGNSIQINGGPYIKQIPMNFPAESDTKDGVDYGPGDRFTGTLAAGGGGPIIGSTRVGGSVR